VFWEEDMGYALSRRQWLKTSTLAFAGLMVRPSLIASERESPYLRNFPEEDKLIRLESNESPFGISEKTREAISRSIDLSNRYPHGHYAQLTGLIAEHEGISPDHIILGAGSTEVMVTLIHWAKSRGEILTGDPTYFDFIYYANQAGCKLSTIRLDENFEHDLESMEKRISDKTGLVYICNPLNPTGSISSAGELRPFCERASEKALVVVDEAYHEYAENPAYSSMIDLVREGKNVIITRTFSKIFGLAGLRIGYGMAHPEIIAKLDKLSRNFAPVSWLSLKAAIASYQDQEFIQSVREKNSRMKIYLTAELDRLGLFFIPSQTNFILFQIDQDAEELAKKFEHRHILVRPFVFHGHHWIRVSIGIQTEMQAFVSALADFI
jgi:histidinol-phosphate aminotransferase